MTIIFDPQNTPLNEFTRLGVVPFSLVNCPHSTHLPFGLDLFEWPLPTLSLRFLIALIAFILNSIFDILEITLFLRLVLALFLVPILLPYAISPPSPKYLPHLLQFQSHFLNEYSIYFFLLILTRIVAQTTLIFLGDTFLPPVLSEYCLTLSSHLPNSLSG
jgi:hypothetical protein